MLQSYYSLFSSDTFVWTFKILFYSSFVWLPLFAIILLWELWVKYVRADFMAKQEYILLEIRIPRDVLKSPQAVEFFIAGLNQQAGEKNWYEKYWKGGLRAWFSLEIVSIDGGVHFFVWTRKSFKANIESNLYSQFPGIEVHEVPDYILPVTYDPEVNNIWGTEFDLTKPDAYPIKTYIDYGLDKNPEEEYKIDPITPLIEFLGSLGRGHLAAVQIIVRAHKAEDKDPATGKMVDYKWAKAAEEEKNKILEAASGKKGEDGKPIPGTGRSLTQSEKDTISALERSVSKTGFDVGIRGIYVAPKDIFNKGAGGGIIGGITHFNSNLNGFKPARGFSDNWSWFPWVEKSAKNKEEQRQHMLDAFKRRAYFHPPFKSPHMVLNSEELATIYHFPGGVSVTPTFTRVESRKAEAPANLPV